MRFSEGQRRRASIAGRFRRPMLERLELRVLLAVGEIELGPSDNVALDQPRVAIELLEDVNPDPVVEEWASVGPGIFNTFLLDTDANSVLAMATAVADMGAPPNDYRTEGQFVEVGVGGEHPMDVSAPYRFDFAGSSGVRNTYYDTRILSDANQDFSMFGPWGLAGMPAMASRVTSFDMTGWSGGGAGLDDLYMKVEYGNEVPVSADHRYALSVDNRIAFDPTEYLVSGEPPIWADIPFFTAIPTNLGIGKEGNFLLDTGAQISVISNRLGIDIGLDSNGDGVLDEHDAAFVSTETVGGVGGSINVPVFAIDELRVPVTRVSTGEEIELVWTDLRWLVLDIGVGEGQPVLDGVFGSDLLTSGWFNAFFNPGMPDGYIDQVHLDFRDWGLHSGTPEPRTGTIYFDLNEAVDQVEIFGPGVRIRETDRSTEVIKGMTTDTYTIALSTIPTAPVQITVTADARTLVSSDGGATFASTLALTFNDKFAQTITVGAVDDGVIEGTQTGIISHSVTSEDVDYNSLAVREVFVRILDGREVVTITEDAAGEIKLDSANVAEGGGDGLYWIRLAEAPANEIWVVVEDLASNQVKVNNPSNTLGDGFENIWLFSSSNWSEPQLIQLTAVDDFLKEGPHRTQLMHTALDIVTAEVVGQNVLPVYIADNDLGGVIISETGGNTRITEEGGEDTYEIALATMPTDAVEITVTADGQTLLSSDNGVTFAPTVVLTFMDLASQTITVRAVNDNVDEGTHTGRITQAVTGRINDPEYPSTLSVPGVTATIADNDTAGLTIVADPDGQILINAIHVVERGADVLYWVTLTSEPKHDVTIFLSSESDQVLAVDDANPANAFVLFTPLSWNMPRAVRVTAIDNHVSDGPHADFVRHSLFSSDPKYQGTVLLKVDIDDAVQPVNNPPTLDPIGDMQILEDSLEVVVPLTGISPGQGDSQPVRITAASNAPEIVPTPTVSYADLDALGSLRFTPLPDANGPVVITVTVEDGGLDGNLATSGDNAMISQHFSVRVLPVQDPPVVSDDTFAAQEGQTLDVGVPGVLANDMEVDGDALSAVLVHSTTHGTLQLHSDGSFVYAPAERFNREDSFQYYVDDGTVQSATMTVTILVETAYPWYNGIRPLNVNDDSYISSIDALIVINELNSNGSHQLTLDCPRPLTKPFLDVNRDGYVSPLDALLVINDLNGGSSGEGESSAAIADAAKPSLIMVANTKEYEPGAGDLSDEVAAAGVTAASSHLSTSFLQSLDLLFAKLDKAQGARTWKPAIGRRAVDTGDLEEFLDSMLNGSAAQEYLLAATAR